jgi:hypothetical protein
MLNKNERMEKLNQAGINTGKYFSIDLPNGLKPGAKISLVINENGEPVLMKEDNIVNQIISDGYVRNTKLHRRFVMAQMFQMLNYKSYYGQEPGYNTCLRERYAYDYTLTMMLEEVRVLSKLEARDKESFEERSHFFTKAAIIAVLEDYVEKVKEHVDNLPNHKCKGVPYKKINGVNIFNEDILKRVYKPIVHDICRIKFANSYSEIYKILNKMMRNRVKLPWNTPKSRAWIDAYKGEGAYYTLKNLVMFHGCGIESGDSFYMGTDAMNILKCKLDEYKGEGWRMFALMKKVIADNNFDFAQRMREIYD